MRRVSPSPFLDDIDDLRQAEAEASPCAHAKWRWLECEDCRKSGDPIACDMKVCVACGAEV
jgi:hypothetical protein